MNTKIKAKEIFDKYCYAIRTNEDDDGFFTNVIQAKNCALISIDEILNDYLNSTYPKDLSIKYWNEIKEEIQKLEK
jgi:hypothetical protein